jgi:hypothetical protein
MRTQIIRSRARTLGPFSTLILTLKVRKGTTEADELLRDATGETSTWTADRIGAEHQVIADRPTIRRPRVTLGPFVTLVLTVLDQGFRADSGCRQSSLLPRGAVFAARYVSC